MVVGNSFLVNVFKLLNLVTYENMSDVRPTVWWKSMASHSATPERWLKLKGHDQLIHKSCAIYFPGGIFGKSMANLIVSEVFAWHFFLKHNPRRLSFHEIPVSWNTNVVTIFPFPNWKLIFWARTWSTQNSGLRIDSMKQRFERFIHSQTSMVLHTSTHLSFFPEIYVSGASCWSFPIGTHNDSYICHFIMTLQGTNISPLKGSWEDDYVGYARSPEN